MLTRNGTGIVFVHSIIMQKKFCRQACALIFAVLLLSGCSNSTPGNSSGSVPGPPSAAGSVTSRGEEIFQQRCIACHGPNGNYRNNNAADLQLSRLDSIGIVNTIKNGRSPMPMFDGVIPDSDMAQLVHYVESLRRE
jgi:mono/diheme cytochrome c family protein